MNKEAMGRLILEASTGMHGEIAKQLSDAWAEQAVNAERYRKLRRWMSSNVPEGWREVCYLASVACYVDWEAFDSMLDSLPECSVGLCAFPKGDE